MIRMGKLIIDVDHKEEALRVQITTPLVAINCPPKAILVMLMTITVMTGVTNFDELKMTDKIVMITMTIMMM